MSFVEKQFCSEENSFPFFLSQHFEDQEKDARMMDMFRCPVKSFEIELTGNKKTNEQFILEHFDFSGIETTADSIVALEMTRSVTKPL